MSKRHQLLKENGNNSYILSSNPTTKSISDDLNETEAREFQVETAKFIERYCSELVVISTRADMNFLAYLLDMARIEASDRIEKPESGKTATVA
ncbi:MAG: hypothetical protein ABJN04_10065 [Hyphomicrobiales bacterium]